jgi:trehalose 6-phosphate synthase/phosphatase
LHPVVLTLFSAKRAARSQTVNEIKAKYGGRKVVCGIDRLERLKGVPVKMVAIERFFRSHPEWIDKVVFIEIGVTASERGLDYMQTKELVRRIVNRINARFSGEHPAVVFEEKTEQEITLPHRLSLFAASDLLLTVAPRDGLNRTPIEYTLAHNGDGREPGMMVLSEFVSAARVMRGAIKLNPWRIDDVVEAVKSALEAGHEERAKRHAKCVEFAARQTTAAWAFQVLLDLKRVNKEYIDPQVYSALGFGLGYRVVGLHAGFQPLNTALVSKCYRTSRNRLVVLDYGGTLVAHEDKTDKVKAYAVASKLVRRTPPPPQLLQLLTQLCADHKNTVFVISGQELYAVAEGFGDVKGLGLAAEHGFYYRVPREHSEGQPRWQTLLSSADQTWKQLVKQIMDVYVQRTSGTYVEHKGTAMIWQFRDADPEFGYMQSKELEDHLTAVLRHYPVEVLRGGGVSDGYIEVRPEGVSKGVLLEHLLATARAANRDPDFVLVIGDDVSDEPMFEAVDRLLPDSSNVSAFTVTVGKKPSHAKAYLDDPSEVVEMLNSLTRVSTQDPKFYSMVDLTKLDRSQASEPPRLRPLELPGHRNLATLTSPQSAGQASPDQSPVASSPIHRSMSMSQLSRMVRPSVLQPPAARGVWTDRCFSLDFSLVVCSPRAWACRCIVCSSRTCTEARPSRSSSTCTRLRRMKRRTRTEAFFSSWRKRNTFVPASNVCLPPSQGPRRVCM